MTSSRQERRRLNKNKMNRNPQLPNAQISVNNNPICDPALCDIECPVKEIIDNNKDFDHRYDEILKKYSLLDHIEKSEFDMEDIDDESVITKLETIEVFSKRFCPEDVMYDYEDRVMKQIDNFFKEIDIEYDETGFGHGFFSASATIEKIQ